MWGNFTQPNLKNVVHSIPLDDLEEHEVKLTCWCNPKAEVYGENRVQYTHHSLDGREHKEPDHDSKHCGVCIANDLQS